jgi:hypothetical protein
MTNRLLNEKFFHVTDDITIICRAERTRSGFRHLATLLQTGERAKETYWNRTWESFEFQTVLRRLASKVGGNLGTQIEKFATEYREESNLGIIGLVAALGIFTDTQKDANDWKIRMIKAGLGEAISAPDDWDTLTEDEKERRLDQAIAELRK